MAVLEATLGLDPSEFEAELKAAENKLKRLEKQKDAKVKLGLDVSDLNKQISTAKGNIADLKDSLSNVGKSFAGSTPKIANGGNALLQFNRIVQDAPFGIQGMANNITASFESFGHLSKSAGGAGEALKAIGASLLGTGGVIAAVSLVTSGLTYMSQNGLTVKDVFDKLTGTFDENARAMSALNAEVAKNASGEISSMKAFVSAASNVNLSMSDRLIAVKKLQDEYPAYFGNLSKEQILNGNVAGAVKEVTAALIAKAKAAALSSKLADLAEKEFLLREKEAKAIVKYKDALHSLNKSTQQFQSGGGVLGATGVSGIGRLSQAENALIDIQNELRSIVATQRLYTSEIEKSVAASLKLETVVTKTPKAKKTNTNEPITKFGGSALQTGGLVDVSGKVVQIAKDVQGAEGLITTSMKNINIAFDMGGVNMLESLQKLNDGFSDIINNGIVNTLSTLGDAIGSALAGGGNVLQAAGNALLSSLGNILSQLGQMAIQTGIGILAIKTALKSLNPYVAIAAGVALVALGGAVTSKSKSLGNSMGSSSGGGNYDTGANYSSPASNSSYTSGGGSYSGGTVVFEIDGQKLVGVLSNTLGRNSKLGGSLGI